MTKKELIERLKGYDKHPDNHDKIKDGVITDSLIGLFRVSLEGEILFINKKLVKSLGYRNMREIGYGKLQRIFRDPHIIEHLIKTITSRGYVDNLEVELITRTGQERTMLLNAQLAGGQVTGMLIDITKRKSVELAYEESEQRYRNLFESANDAIFISDADSGYILDANRKAEKLMEMPAIEIIGKHQSELYPVGDREKNIERSKEDNKQPIPSVELYLESKTGKKIPVEVSSSTIQIQGKRLKQSIFRDLTERKKAEQAIINSEERYRELVENINEVIFSVDKNGILTYISPVVSSITGSRPEEIIGGHFTDFVYEDDIESIIIAFEDSLENRPQIGDYRIITKSNNPLWVKISAKPIVLNDEVVGVQGIVYDIHSIKEAEENKQAMERKYESLITHIPDTIVELDREGKFTYISSKVRDIYGYEPGELIGNSPIDVIHPDDLENVMDSIFRAFTEQRYRNIEFRVRHKNGSYVPASSSGSVLDENGNLKLVGIVRDITEQKKAEQAVRESEEKFRLLFQNANEGILYIDRYGNIKDANPKVLEITEIEKDKIVGKNFIELIELFKIKDDDILETFESMISGKGFTQGEWSITNNNGEIRNLLARPAPIWKNGDIIGLNVVIEDITEQGQFQSRIIQERKRAELYLDILSHDIKNLDQVIITTSELLLSRPDFPDKYRRYLEDSRTQAEAISELITSVKKLTEVKDAHFEHELIDVNQMLSNSIDLVAQLYPDRTIKINNELMDSEIHVEGNGLLQDVFNNILTNAVKYNRNGDVEIDIKYAVEPDSGFYRFEFRDNGPGVPDELKQRIFKRFERGDCSISGTGLGLTIAHEVVSRFGGSVWVEDCVAGNSSKGSKFVIKLPGPVLNGNK